MMKRFAGTAFLLTLGLAGWSLATPPCLAEDGSRVERALNNYPALGKGAVIAANGNVGDRLYLEILAGLAIEYGWPSGQPFKR